ncbi:MAG: arginine deiminase-related protein [Pseudomonadota bacterium]
MTQSVRAQSTDTVVMVRPVGFHANPLTASSNAFQVQEATMDAVQSNALAQQQFDGLVSALRAHGVNVLVFDDTPAPPTPDSIFPNNWLSTHADGSVVLYPMEAVNRRTERRMDIVDALNSEHGFDVLRTLDWSEHEARGVFLEGTGSLILDRVHRVAYACVSTRTDTELAHQWCEAFGYEPVLFAANDANGKAIYHTNVMMCVGSTFAVVCVDSIDPQSRDLVLQWLDDTGHDVIPISHAAVAGFAGNMLELVGGDGALRVAMSAQAEAALTPAQHQQLAQHARIVSAPIDHIEAQSGGSVRCMLAEVFLPHR